MQLTYAKGNAFTIHTNTTGLRLGMSPLWTANANVCAFDGTHRAQCAKRITNYAFSNEERISVHGV